MMNPEGQQERVVSTAAPPTNSCKPAKKWISGMAMALGNREAEAIADEHWRQTGRQAGDYLRQYRKSHGVELGDALIASAALLNRAKLWTRNHKHYPMKELSFY